MRDADRIAGPFYKKFLCSSPWNKKIPQMDLWDVLFNYLLSPYFLNAFFKLEAAMLCASFASGTTSAIPKNSCVTPSYSL